MKGFYSNKNCQDVWIIASIVSAISIFIMFLAGSSGAKLFWSSWLLLSIPVVMEILFWGDRDTEKDRFKDYKVGFTENIIFIKLCCFFKSILILIPAYALLNIAIPLVRWLSSDPENTKSFLIGFGMVVLYTGGVVLGIIILCGLVMLWIKLNALKYDPKKFEENKKAYLRRKERERKLRKKKREEKKKEREKLKKKEEEAKK